MPPKRKLEIFDPNKSDSADTDFDPSSTRASAKKPRKSSTKKHTGGSKKRSKRGGYGSDVSDDDVEDEISDLGYSGRSEEEEEEVEMNEKTGRAVRKAAKKAVNYGEDSESSSTDEVTGDIPDSNESDVPPKKQPRSKRVRLDTEESEARSEEGATKRVKSKVVKLKIPHLGQTTARSTRSASAAARTRGSTEPRSALPPIRRNTRAHTEEGDEPIALSDSGHHIIRAGHSPEPIGRAARTARAKKAPAATIKEEIHETSSYEQVVREDTPMADAEIAGTDEPDEVDALGEKSDIVEVAANEMDVDVLVMPEDEDAQPAADADDEDEEDDMPVTRTGRTRGSKANLVAESIEGTPAEEPAGRRLTRGSRLRQGKKSPKETDDVEFEPEGDSDDEMSASDQSPKKNKNKGDGSDSGNNSGVGKKGKKSKSNSRRRGSGASDDAEDEIDADEVAEEAADLKESNSRKRRQTRNDDIEYSFQRNKRQRKEISYVMQPLPALEQEAEEEEETQTSSRKARGGRSRNTTTWERKVNTTYGPFGGWDNADPLVGGPWGTGAAGNVDSDSSDDEKAQRPFGVGGDVGMTPTSGMPPGLLPGLGQTHNADGIAGISGTPANVGKVKSQKALADADPLGVDQNVDFSKVGGLEGHIDQLKEMVQMPLLYPELFQKFHVTPPRGVLFHGPPGTGKTLLARALAASVGSGGRKITFYMRKGADALSKWVGEAERQLRLLFEEARRTQPSIIFFDEIDGLAPVRSSKQEQIHASIVSTLLALMDGMDGRGQVIVIGATNRPDNIDPALRRPGRFDREFYFPLPDVDARKSIINIHTKDWPITDAFKTELAHQTKGYGGADLRALCTEASLNAIQRTYPQIYTSNEKLKVNMDKIKITAKDFMISIKKIVPSSERATSSGATPLPKDIEPLLCDQLKQIEGILDTLIPIKKRTTALQEAMYEQYEDQDDGFRREVLQQEFEKSRVYRPRLLICGEPGMGQSYLGGAILNHFEGLHVQSFDLPTIFSDSARSPEAAIVQLFAEVKRHKPSVIYLPGVDTWYQTISEPVITTFISMLNAIPPTDPVLVLGITEKPADKLDSSLLGQLFGFSRKNRFAITRPSKQNRQDFFAHVIEKVKLAPKEYPDPLNRKKRQLEVLEVIPPPPPAYKGPTKEELRVIKKRDNVTLNQLKVAFEPVMNQIRQKYRQFRHPFISQDKIQYLYDEKDPNFVRGDVPQSAEARPFEIGTDKKGVPGLIETATGKFYYNLDIVAIDERLANGFYARPKDFRADIKSLFKDAKNFGDPHLLRKANELLTNVTVDTAMIEARPELADCENVYLRMKQRVKQEEERQRQKVADETVFDSVVRSDIVEGGLDSERHSSGPFTAGESGKRSLATPLHTPRSSNLSNGYSADIEHHHGLNGTSIPSRSSDALMSNTDEANSQGMQPPLPHPSGPSSSHFGTNPNTQFSQRSIFQEISHDTSPRDLINDASTTTSGKKTSDGWSTQVTNGISNQASSPIERPGDSQLPDTQRNTQTDTSEEWPHSQAHAMARGHLAATSQTPSSGSQASQNPAVPSFNAAPRISSSKSHPASFANLLNNSPVEPTSSQASSQKDMIIDEFFLNDLLTRLVTGSSGCSIEQLQQINRELTCALWNLRGEYNRNQVASELVKVFNDTITDIEEMQRVLAASQPEQSQVLV